MKGTLLYLVKRSGSFLLFGHLYIDRPFGFYMGLKHEILYELTSLSVITVCYIVMRIPTAH